MVKPDVVLYRFHFQLPPCSSLSFILLLSFYNEQWGVFLLVVLRIYSSVFSPRFAEVGGARVCACACVYVCVCVGGGCVRACVRYKKAKGAARYIDEKAAKKYAWLQFGIGSPNFVCV